MKDAKAHVLDEEQASFICSGISMSAASCRSGGVPSLARAVGCRTSADRRAVTVLFAETASAALLEDVRRTGTIAVVFSRPADHRTLQLKGKDALIVPVEAGDAELSSRQIEIFVEGLSALGYQASIVRSVLASSPEDLLAVRFTVEAAFSQTPGPAAGEALQAGR
jgi:hypothetical protein